MDNRVYFINLYDYYSELLTEKQQDYFQDYYFQNLTLSEISENYQISRNAVHKQIKEVEEKLVHYEEVLHLYEKAQKIQKLITNLDPKIKEQIEELI